MNDIVREAIEKYVISDEMKEKVLAEFPRERIMWVITNSQGINGASSMLYENELHQLAEELGCDLYILPSSVHEVIAIPADLGEAEEFAEQVTQINMTEVLLEERLSNQVYHYDKDLRRLALATDTPNKWLDGIVAETRPIYETREDQIGGLDGSGNDVTGIGCAYPPAERRFYFPD